MIKEFKSYKKAVKNLDKIDQSNFDQMRLADDRGLTIAHMLATAGKLKKEYITPEILKMATTDDGWTVAHELAYVQGIPEEFITPEILKMATTEDGWTVAHELAMEHGIQEKFITPEILKMATTDNNKTVAHVLSKRQGIPEKFMTPDILLLNSEGDYVYEQVPKYSNLTLDSAKDVLSLYLLARSKYKYPDVSFEDFKKLTKSHGLDKMKQMIKLTGKKDD